MTSSRHARQTPPNISLNLGSIDNAGNFGQQFPEAAELQPSAPVFVTPIDDGLAERVTGRAILRMGIIPLPTGGAILSIRVQRSTTQFVWLADPTDREVWQALDTYEKIKQTGFGFRSEKYVYFTPYETQDNIGVLDVYKSEIGRRDRMFCEAATALIAHGDLKKIFPSMREGIKVKDCRVCILGTAQVKADFFARGGVMSW
jgi:hypothetical protein